MTDWGDSADGIAREGVTIIRDGGGGNIPICNNSKELRGSYLPHGVLELRDSNGQYGIYGVTLFNMQYQNFPLSVCLFRRTVPYLISALENKFKDIKDAHGDGYQMTLLSDAEMCNALEI